MAEFQVYLSTPRSIREPTNPLDPDAANPELVPAFVAYSASGQVQAPVVYVNIGLPPGYSKLESAGIDVRGKIVMARYAKSRRAVKIHTAQEHGSAAIIIYSNPADDGYAKALTWPEGPWRADFQSQDGNGKYSWFWHGDPLSPGVGARRFQSAGLRQGRAIDREFWLPPYTGNPTEHWYRHVIYGWNIYSLYDGQPLPELAEAIRVKDPERVAQETERIENALRRMLAELRQAGG